jgi:hypothetical protein
MTMKIESPARRGPVLPRGRAYDGRVVLRAHLNGASTGDCKEPGSITVLNHHGLRALTQPRRGPRIAEAETAPRLSQPWARPQAGLG